MSITFNLVPNNAAASAVFVEQEPVSRGGASPLIPHKIAVLGQYDSSKSPTVNEADLVLDKEAAWTKYGRGSMLSLLIEAVLRDRGNVPVYAIPLDDDGTAAAAEGKIVITGTATEDGTLALYVGGQRVAVSVSDEDTADEVGAAIVSALAADLDVPVTGVNTAGTVVITVDWDGESGNQLTLEANMLDTDSTPAGLTVTITDIGDETPGSTNPVLDTALDNLGDTWYTEIVCPYLDSTSLTAIDSAGDDRIDPGVKRPFVAFAGYTDTSANFITKLGTLNTQWLTIVPVHGSSTPAYEIAAAVTGTFAKVQQSNPGRPVKNQTIKGILAGSGNVLTYTTRDTVVRAGGSHTYNQSDGTVTVGDLVTTRTETAAGAATEDWRFTIIIPNIQFKIYALENTFLGSPFDQAVVLADGGPAGPTFGIRPKTVKTYAIQLVDDWVSRGLSTTRDTIVDGIEAEIDSANAGRINLLIPDVPSAGLRILAAKLEWAFVTG